MNCIFLKLAVLAAFLLASAVLGKSSVNPKLSLTKVSRKIDLTTQVAKVTSSITLKNDGESSEGSFLLAIEPSLSDKLSYTSVSTKIHNEEETILVLKETELESHSETKFFEVELLQRIQGGASIDLNIEEVYSHALSPFPAKIGQSEKQFVLFAGNHYLYTPYTVVTQTTTVNLASSSVESFSKLKPASVSDSTVTYGPYGNAGPFKSHPMRIHFENNSPFLAVVEMTRTIEVSHWGNIAVEESFHVKHVGAQLKGSFSRYDYQRSPAPASIKSFKCILPAAAADVYYRDEIGNISTSNLFSHDEAVDLELRPRFPLFGGWQTHFYIGYNVPSYEYLYNMGNHYMLKMRVVDHVYDEFVVDRLSVRVILPEGSMNIKLNLPYDLSEDKRELHFTYLDTVGRPVITLHKENLVEQHIQEFEIHYMFNKLLLLQEPLLVVGALYLLFMLVIVYVRMDFTISKDEASEARMRAAGLIEEVQRYLDRRSGLYNVYSDAISKFKSGKDATVFANARKKLDADYRSLTNRIVQIQSALNKDQPEAADKIGELQRKEQDRKQLLEQAILMAEKVVNNRMSKQVYVDGETLNRNKRERMSVEIEAIASSL